MKKTLLYLGIAALALTSCNKKEKDPATPESKLPSAAGIEFVVNVDQATNEATFSLPSDVTGLTPIWHTNETGEFVFAGTGDNFKKTFTLKGTYGVRLYVSNAQGQSLDFSQKEFVIENDKAGTTLSGGFVYDSEFNIWKVIDEPANHVYHQYTAQTSAWTVIDNPAITQVGNTYSMTYEQETNDQWQAQFFIIPTQEHAITLQEGVSYDFSCVILSSTDLPGVTVKFTQDGDDNNFLFTSQRIPIKAGEPYVFWWADQVAKAEIPNCKMVFDFGGCPAGSEITVGNIVLKDHANDDGTTNVPGRDPEPEPEPEDPNKGFVDEYDTNFKFDLEAPANLWAASTTALDKLYYAPNWAEIALDQFTHVYEDGEYMGAYPVATDSRWQNQVHIQSSCAIVEGQKYALTFTVVTNVDHPGFFAKLTNRTDDGEFFAVSTDIKTKANEPRIFHATGIVGKANDGARLIFDFGPSPENFIVYIQDISLQIYE